MTLSNTIKTQITAAFVQLMGSIIRLALRNGISCKEFTDLCKLLYVKIASEEYGIRGRETNIARVSVMTGIDRRDVKILRSRIKDIDSYHSEPSRISKILSEWHNNPLYSDNGKPKSLCFEGTENSFTSLVKQHAKALAPVTVLKELKQSKAVVDTKGNKLRALRRDYIPNYHGHNAENTPEFSEPDAITQGSSMLVDHINTIFHNLYRLDKSESPRFDMRATNEKIRISDIPDFYKFMDEWSMNLLIKIDKWLSAREQEGNNKSEEPYVRLGLGIYSIEGDNKSVM